MEEVEAEERRVDCCEMAIEMIGGISEKTEGKNPKREAAVIRRRDLKGKLQNRA